MADVPVEAEPVGVHQGRQARRDERQGEPRSGCGAEPRPTGPRSHARPPRWPRSRARPGTRRGCSPGSIVKSGTDAIDPSPALVLLLADAECQVHEREREEVGPDQEMDRTRSPRCQDGHDHGDHRRDAVADQARRQRRVDARQPQGRRRDGRRPARVVDDQGQQDVEAPRLVDPGGVRSRVNVRVSYRGTVPAARMSRPSRRCQDVPGSLNRPMRPPIRIMPRTTQDQLTRSGDQATGACPGGGHREIASNPYSLAPFLLLYFQSRLRKGRDDVRRPIWGSRADAHHGAGLFSPRGSRLYCRTCPYCGSRQGHGPGPPRATYEIPPFLGKVESTT